MTRTRYTLRIMLLLCCCALAAAAEEHLEPIQVPGALETLGRKPRPGWPEIRRVTASCAHRYGIRETYLYAVMKVTSGFKLGYRSHAGAQGLMSLMPGTARKLGVTDPYHPAQNRRLHGPWGQRKPTEGGSTHA